MKAKKIFAVALSLVLLVAMAVPALAAGTNTVEVTSTVSGETYSIYKMMEVSVDDPADPHAYRYTVATEWAAFFTGTGEGAPYVNIDAQGYVTWETTMSSATNMEAFSKKAATYADGKTKAATDIVSTGGDITFTGLDNGYYLITSTLGTRAMTATTPDNPSATINEKNPLDTVTKHVKEDSAGTFGSENDAQIGDEIEFESVVTLVKNTRNVVLHDKMDDALTLVSGSISIAGLTAGTHYTVETSPTDLDTFDITFLDTYLDTLTGSTNLTVLYKATLNQGVISATPSLVDVHNTATLTYGGTQTQSSQTTTKTHSFQVYKHANGATANLAGAVFELKKGGAVVNLIKIDDNNYRVANAGETGTVTTFTTVATGNITIWGVDSDNDYTLNETQAPDGYNRLPTERSVNVAADNSLVMDIENSTGSELPSTGGIGTTIFYVVGTLLLLSAGVLLVTRFRMKGENK